MSHAVEIAVLEFTFVGRRHRSLLHNQATYTVAPACFEFALVFRTGYERFCTLAMHLISEPVPIEYITIRALILTPALPLVVDKISFISPADVILQNASALVVITYESAFVSGPVRVRLDALASAKISYVLADVDIACREPSRALPLPPPGDKLALVLPPIRKTHHADAVRKISYEVTLIDVSRRVLVGALPLALSRNELALVPTALGKF